MEQLTQEQIDKILIKISDELELFIIENYKNEILRNLSVSLKNLE